MEELTQRQKSLLLSIIAEFIETAEAVGSISLQNKYNLRVSTATIRNEMADLVDLGYLYQKHLSGGRIPTTKGWRYFVDELDKNLKEIEKREQEEIEDNLVKRNASEEELIRESIGMLSSITGNASIALIDKEIYYAGLSEIVDIPEFRDQDNLRRMLTILEDYYTLSKVLNKENSDDEVKILIGEETDLDIFNDYSIIFTEIVINGDKLGYIAVLGPMRMRYNKVIPTIKYISSVVRNLLKNR